MKKIYIALALAFIGLVITTFSSCVNDHEGFTNTKNNETTLTLDEARQFFEEYISSEQVATRLSRSDIGERPGTDPGDFTPLWDKAKISGRDIVESVDVPIDADYLYTAKWVAVIGPKKTVGYTHVPITQKLIVVKNKEVGKLSTYIMNVIPNRDCYKRHRDSAAKEFLNAGSSKNFSGLIVYTDIEHNALVRVDQYYNGEKVRAASVFDGKPAETTMNEMQEIMRYLILARAKKSTNTRAQNDEYSYLRGGDNTVYGSDAYDAHGNLNTYYTEYGYYNSHSNYSEWPMYNYAPSWSDPHSVWPEYGRYYPDYVYKAFGDTEMFKQLPGNNSCVLNCWTFMDNSHGGILRPETFAAYYDNYVYEEYGKIHNSMKDGVFNDDILNVTATLFNTVKFTSFEDAFARGHEVFTNVVGRNGLSHGVVVGGTNDMGEYCFKDPYTGKEGSAPKECFGVNYAIEITGRKQ